MDVYRTPVYIDLSGVLQMHLASEVSHDITMRVLPAAFELTDVVDLARAAYSLTDTVSVGSAVHH